MDADAFEFTCQYCETTVPFEDEGRHEALLAQQRTAAQQGPGSVSSRDVVAALTEKFEEATSQTHVDHPLCAKCLEFVQKDLMERIAAAEAQVKSYQHALDTLQPQVQREEASAEQQHSGGDLTASASMFLSLGELQDQLEAAETEEQGELARTKRLEGDLAQAEADLASVAAQEEQLMNEEGAFWKRYNALWLDLQQSVQETEAIETKTNVAAHHLDYLRQSSALDECFHIWFQGRFGTISGFRLGRYGDEVKWTEVNAAWGQAVLLLDVMTRMYPDFLWQGGVLKPMASHPEVSDGKVAYKLFGPVKMAVLSGSGYDKAMTLYLSCLHSFAKFAHDKDVRERRANPVQLPNPIDPDRATIRGCSIRYGMGMGTADVWNKALKYMLVNLKVLMHWVITDHALADPPAVVVPPQMQATASSPQVRASGSMAASVIIGNMAASMMAPSRSSPGASSSEPLGARSMFSFSRKHS